MTASHAGLAFDPRVITEVLAALERGESDLAREPVEDELA